jgi:hypothetical protein
LGVLEGFWVGVAVGVAVVAPFGKADDEALVLVRPLDDDRVVTAEILAHCHSLAKISIKLAERLMELVYVIKM